MSTELSAPKGFVSGTGVIRNPDGSIKAHFTLSGEATEQQFREVFGEEKTEPKEGQ